MVNEKITPEGLFTYVFYALCEEGDNGMEYVFLTNSDGDHVAKTPLGMFKDKNLIVITAEAFSPIAIDKELTPTLYKMYTEGFSFRNNYKVLSCWCH